MLKDKYNMTTEENVLYAKKKYGGFNLEKR